MEKIFPFYATGVLRLFGNSCQGVVEVSLLLMNLSCHCYEYHVSYGLETGIHSGSARMGRT